MSRFDPGFFFMEPAVDEDFQSTGFLSLAVARRPLGGPEKMEFNHTLLSL